MSVESRIEVANEPHNAITGNQIVAARGLLGIGQKEIAHSAGTRTATICRIERMRDRPINEITIGAATKQRVIADLERRGVEFIMGDCPRCAAGGEMKGPSMSDAPFHCPPDKPKKRGGRSPKNKGALFEREVVALLQERGLAAEKMPLSGALGGKYGGDVSCPVRTESKRTVGSLGHTDQKIECKRRARAFASIDKWLGKNYALVIRDDRSRPMVVMSLDDWAELAK